MRGEVKRAFNPEFLNRLDDIILFNSLTDDDLVKIIELMVEQVNANLVAKQIKIRLSPDASKYILEKTCLDRSYGARPLRRALQKHVEDPLSEALIQGSLPRPSELEGLPGRHRDLLPPGGRQAAGAGGRARRPGAGNPAVLVLRHCKHASSAGAIRPVSCGLLRDLGPTGSADTSCRSRADRIAELLIA